MQHGMPTSVFYWNAGPTSTGSSTNLEPVDSTVFSTDRWMVYCDDDQTSPSGVALNPDTETELAYFTSTYKEDCPASFNNDCDFELLECAPLYRGAYTRVTPMVGFCNGDKQPTCKPYCQYTRQSNGQIQSHNGDFHTYGQCQVTVAWREWESSHSPQLPPSRLLSSLHRGTPRAMACWRSRGQRHSLPTPSRSIIAALLSAAADPGPLTVPFCMQRPLWLPVLRWLVDQRNVRRCQCVRPSGLVYVLPRVLEGAYSISRQASRLFYRPPHFDG